MNSARSGSERSFELLHPKVQRWVWEKGWPDLHDVQNRAIPPIIACRRDVLIGAATAAGKTEAAFLPICSRLVADDATEGAGIRVLCLSPLKALINDQFRRVDDLCQGLGLRTHRWHGDVAVTKKKALLDSPSGILLTTPESLEAMFVLRGTKIRRLFAGLRYVVVDELHSFLGVERGTQLVSLLHRLETTIRAAVPRIGLSATLGDMSIAAEQLRPGGGDDVVVVSSPSGGQELRLQVRGYVNRWQQADADEYRGSAAAEIAEHIYGAHRGRTNLVFTNSRNGVEEYTSRLTDLSTGDGVPNEFHPHHGSLAKELREDVEALLRDRDRPATAVCTSTLEMGIDIGDVAQVAQVGPPPSVAALRQRIGRSGRRGSPPVLRAYVSTVAADQQTRPMDRLHPELVQLIAMVELLTEHWCEPPRASRLDLSTLVQQVLSLIVQHGGASPRQAYDVLCGRGGPFSSVTEQQFATLIRDLAGHDVLMQAGDGTLLTGGRGDAEVNHYSFFAAFASPEEYRIVHDGDTLGTMPMADPLHCDDLLAFAGRRWRVLSVDDEDKVILVCPASGGPPRMKAPSSGAVHTVVRQRMRAILADDSGIGYVDEAAARLLAQARRDYARLRLGERAVLRDGGDALILPWVGDLQLVTLAELLRAGGLGAEHDGIAVRVEDTDVDATLDVLRAIVVREPPTEAELAEHVLNKMAAKYDHWLGDSLLCAQYASTSLDCAGAIAAAEAVVALSAP